MLYKTNVLYNVGILSNKEIMAKPLITVVTVTYNLIKNNRRESFIKALESVKNQSYKDIEHIVIDGASDDGTVDLIQEYAKKDWVKFISEPDAGLYDAMNKGAMMAQGKYIIFLNSDDYFSGPKGIEKSIAVLEQNNFDYTYAKAKIINDNEERIDSHLHNKSDFSSVFVEMPFCHQTLIVKTEVFKKLGMFNLQYKSAADYDFVLKLVFNNFRQVFIPYEFVTYRMGGYSNADKTLSINEVVNIYYKNYNLLCELSLEECQNIFSSKIIPLKLLNKLILSTNLGLKTNLLLIIKYYRKKLIRVRFSSKNPCLEILGIKIIKEDAEKV